MGLFVGLVLPILVLVWTVITPYGIYQSKKAEKRHLINESQVDLRSALVKENADSESMGLKKSEYIPLIVKTFNECIPNMQRVDVWLGEWRHTHAFIVARNPTVHSAGIPVVEYIVGLLKES
jgi:hypothetical protein